MTKNFCDICGKEARKSVKLEIYKQIGEARRDEEENRIHTNVRVSVNFGFVNHPTGFGGPPDLCDFCVLTLIDELKAAAERGRF